MGCVASRPADAEDGDPLFRGLDTTPDGRCKMRSYMQFMERERHIPYTTHYGLLLGMARTGEWCIYLHFTDWPVPVTAEIVDTLVAQFQAALHRWLSKLKGYHGFPTRNVKVKVFGFVFQQNVRIAPSFLRKYGKYPMVTNWRADTEVSPWHLHHKGKPFPSQNFYQPGIDLMQLTVVGNRTETGATFSPSSWKDYVHPEGVRGFATKYWHGTRWAAFAQRQYLRVGGVPVDYTTGAMGPRLAVLKHEMGHCLFLDDLYGGKYPSTLPECGACACRLQNHDSIMHDGARTLQRFDHAMLRRSWDVQVKRFGRPAT